MKFRKQTARPSLRGAVAFTLGTALMLTACSNTPSSLNDDSVTLTVWTWSNEAREAFNNGIIDTFEEEHSGIKIEVLVQPDKDYQTMLTTGLAGSGGPDIAAIRSYGVISSFAESGNLVPLDDVVSDWSEFSDLALTGASSRSDGKIYAVPQGIQTAQMFFNKTIFAEHGLEIPSTWDEFLDVCASLDAAGVTPIVIPGAEPAQIALAGEVIGNARRGAEEFTTQFVSGEVSLTDPANVASIELMGDIEKYLIDNATSVTLDEAVTVFTMGQAAMFPSGTWQVASFANIGSDLDYGTFDIPANTDWPSEEVTVAYADGGWALSSRSDNPDEARVFVEWLATSEFSSLYANAMGTIPARGGVTVDDPHVADMYQRYLENPSTYLGAAYLRYGNPWGTDVYGEEVQRMWLGQTDAEAVAQAIQTGVAAWFDPADFR